MVECPLCKGTRRGRRWTREGEWTVAACSGCGLLITTPRPTPDVTAAVYSDSYYDTYPMNQGSEATWLERGRSILRFVDSESHRVLDYGAGEGHLVQAFLRLGCDARGVDSSAAARASALRERGLRFDERLPAAAGTKFDLITFVHSLEHVVDPVSTLREAATLLAADGRIFIEVPNAATVEMWWPAMRRGVLGVPGHIYHFVPDSLTMVVEAAGLAVRTVQLSNPRIVEWPLSLRERWKRKRSVAPTVDSASAAAPAVNGASAATGGDRGASSGARLWRTRALPWIRRHLPGAKFQLVATKAR